MQFKHLAVKTKGSLFLILLVIVGIGVFVLINNGSGEKAENKKKHATEVNSSNLGEERKDSPGEKDGPEPNVPSDSNVPSRTGSGGNKNTPLQNKPDFGTVDGGEYYHTFNGRVELYENPFFGMKVNFPEGWTMRDKLEQNALLGEVFDASKYYLFTSLFLDKLSPGSFPKLTLGVRAEKYPDGPLKYLEGIKASKKYYTESMSGPDGNQQTQKESEATEITEITINNNKFYQFSVTMGEFSNFSYFVYPWKNGIIIFETLVIAEDNGLQMLKELLNGTTFIESASTQNEMP